MEPTTTQSTQRSGDELWRSWWRVVDGRRRGRERREGDNVGDLRQRLRRAEARTIARTTVLEIFDVDDFDEGGRRRLRWWILNFGDVSLVVRGGREEEEKLAATEATGEGEK